MHNIQPFLICHISFPYFDQLMIGLTTGITKIDGFHLRDVSHEIVVYQVPSFETGLIILKWKNIKRETSR